MSDDALIRLLREIQNAGTPIQPSVPCEEVRDLLGVFAQAELADEPVLERYPVISQHLQECAECLNRYETIREMLMVFETEAIPQRTPVRTPVPPESPIAWALRRLGEWMDGWQIYQPQPAFAGATRRAGSAKAPPVFARELGAALHPDGARVMIFPEVEDELAYVLVQIDPVAARPADGETILYRVITNQPPTVEIVTRQPFRADGVCEFEDLPLDNYMMTFRRADNDEIELVWLGRELWGKL